MRFAIKNWNRGEILKERGILVRFGDGTALSSPGTNNVVASLPYHEHRRKVDSAAFSLTLSTRRHVILTIQTTTFHYCFLPRNRFPYIKRLITQRISDERHGGYVAANVWLSASLQFSRLRQLAKRQLQLAFRNSFVHCLRDQVGRI